MNKIIPITYICLLIFIIFVGLIFFIDSKTYQTIKNNADWKKQWLNLYVPSKYSDLCGFGEKNCSEFSFVGGGLPTKFIDTSGLNKFPRIFLRDDKIVMGNIDSKNIAVVPYNWCWGSCGDGIYVVQKEESNRIIGRIDMYKDQDYKIKIENNKIFVIVRNPRFIEYYKPYTTICAFKNEILTCNKEEKIYE